VFQADSPWRLPDALIGRFCFCDLGWAHATQISADQKDLNKNSTQTARSKPLGDNAARKRVVQMTQISADQKEFKTCSTQKNGWFDEINKGGL